MDQRWYLFGFCTYLCIRICSESGGEEPWGFNHPLKIEKFPKQNYSMWSYLRHSAVKCFWQIKMCVFFTVFYGWNGQKCIWRPGCILTQKGWGGVKMWTPLPFPNPAYATVFHFGFVHKSRSMYLRSFYLVRFYECWCQLWRIYYGSYACAIFVVIFLLQLLFPQPDWDTSKRLKVSKAAIFFFIWAKCYPVISSVQLI